VKLTGPDESGRRGNWRSLVALPASEVFRFVSAFGEPIVVEGEIVAEDGSETVGEIGP
jgi:hypothetical protein